MDDKRGLYTWTSFTEHFSSLRPNHSMNQNIALLFFLLGCVSYRVFAHGDGEHDEEEDHMLENPWKRHWMAHGICASIAWAILVPLAIGSSLLRKLLEKELGFHKSAWFSIHFALNTLAALLTVISFSIAVYISREEYGKSNWKEHTHFIVGLVIFLLTLMQAVIGMFRPRRHAKVSLSDEAQQQVGGDQQPSFGLYRVQEKLIIDRGAPEEEVEVPLTKTDPVTKEKETASTTMEEHENEETVDIKPAKKSIPYVFWQAKHRIFGIVLLAISWWNVYSGWELFGQVTVDGEDFGNAWLGVGGGVLGVIIILYAIQMVRTQNYSEQNF